MQRATQDVPDSDNSHPKPTILNDIWRFDQDCKFKNLLQIIKDE